MICCGCCGRPIAVILGERFARVADGGLICEDCQGKADNPLDRCPLQVEDGADD